MTYIARYATDAPDREAVDALPGVILLEFGADWCGHCQGAQAAIKAALAPYPDLRHIKVEDGPGRRLGRGFRVKLWPTLILLQDGQEIGRIVRPTGNQEISDMLGGLTAG